MEQLKQIFDTTNQEWQSIRNRMDLLEGMVLEMVPPEKRPTKTTNQMSITPDPPLPPKTLPPPDGKVPDRPWSQAVSKIFDEFDMLRESVAMLGGFLAPISIKDKLNPEIPPPDDLGDSAIFKDMNEILFKLRVVRANVDCTRKSLFL